MVLVLMVVFYCRKANRGYLLSIIFQTLCFRKAPGASKLESFPRQRYLPFRGFSAFQQSIGCCFWGKWNCKGHLTHCESSSSDTNSPLIDEWLEIERTSLRNCASSKTKVAALAKVEEALTSGNGSFLVGGSLSLADIVVALTLSRKNNPIRIRHSLHPYRIITIPQQCSSRISSLCPWRRNTRWTRTTPTI